MGRGHQQQNIKSKDAVPSLVAVAIEAGKSSQHALKWAADHLFSKTQLFFLLHVRHKIVTIPTPTGQHYSISEVDEDVASTFPEQIDLQTKELLLPFQCFCNRRGPFFLMPTIVDFDQASTRFGASLEQELSHKRDKQPTHWHHHGYNPRVGYSFTRQQQ